jgi:hypothetical protein
MRRLSVPGRLAPILLLCTPALALQAQSVRVSTGTIEDRRTTGRFFGGLEVELKLTGDDLADAKAVRIQLKKAEDETGQDLMTERSAEGDFQDAAQTLRLNLKNPSRKASALREVSGELQLFTPGKDPAATAVVDRFMSRMDKAVTSPALKSAKIDLKLVSPKAYRANAQKAQAEMEKEMEKHKAEMEKEAAKEGMGTKEIEALMGLAQGLMGMMGDVGDNDLIFEVKDEQGRLFDIEVVNKAGEKIDRRGSMTSGGLRILNFGEKIPADARLRVLIRTDKAVVKSPFALKEVALP